MTPLLELRGVVVRAGGRVVLRVARLDVRSGETLAVLGANGAGKSTLLRVAGALRPHDEGAVLLDGSPAGEAELRRATAAVLQRPLLRRGGVEANAALGLRLRGIRRGEAHRRAGPWLERLGVAHLRGRAARSLSGGEAQRLSLARALAVEPRLLLLDEPLSALDEATRGELVADLADVLAGSGTAALLVTHDWTEAAALARRTAILHQGELRQVGPTAEVVEHPADAACARVLGYENVWGADAATVLLGRPSPPVALRAEDVSVFGGLHTAGPAVTVAATVERAVPLGRGTRIHARAAGGQRLVATAPPGVSVLSLAGGGAGQVVELAVPLDRLRRLRAPASFDRPGNGDRYALEDCPGDAVVPAVDAQLLADPQGRRAGTGRCATPR